MKEQGQALVLAALAFIFVVLPAAALGVDAPSYFETRREFQKLADAACLEGAIAATKGRDVEAAILDSFAVNAVDPSLYSPIGTGTSLLGGYETYPVIRVGLTGLSPTWFSQFIPGFEGWTVSATAACQEGIAAFLPLSLKEWEGPGSRIYPNPAWTWTPDSNDEWSGPCSDQDFDANEVSPPNRGEPYCWVWGDIQVLAGDGHRVNEGGTSMNGLIAPDVRCEYREQPCVSKVFIPPAPEGAGINTLKALTKDYITQGGYDGPLPYVGVYEGIHSALIGQQEGVSNQFLAQEIAAHFGAGDLLVVFVYRDGELYDGNKNYDYVEVIGYAVVRIVDIDANTIWVNPIYPERNMGDPSTLADDLPTTPNEIKDAGFEFQPILIPWD